MQTPFTRMLKIKYPVLLAGMANISMPQLAAAVCNAGGLGVVGGAFISPETLRQHLRELKSLLVDKSSPFGVDLLLPKVGDGARATNGKSHNNEPPSTRAQKRSRSKSSSAHMHATPRISSVRYEDSQSHHE